MSQNTIVMYCGKTAEFTREARRFQEYWNIPDHRVKDFSNYLGYRRKYEVLLFLNEKIEKDVKHIAIFCHGWKNGIELGFKNDDIPLLAKFTIPIYSVILYCCNCGKRGGFAERLSSEDGKGLEVYAHTTKGHVTMNPHVVNYSDIGSPCNMFPIDAKHRLFDKFQKMLRNYDGELRFLYPFMNNEDLIDTVESGKIVKPW